jgi:hypothetical protein
VISRSSKWEEEKNLRSNWNPCVKTQTKARVEDKYQIACSIKDLQKSKHNPNELIKTTIIKKKPPRTKIKYFENDDDQGREWMKIIGTERDTQNKANRSWISRKEEEEEEEEED